MDRQLSFVRNRQFWTGAGATLIAAILVGMGTTNLNRARLAKFDRRGRSSYVMQAETVTAMGVGSGGGAGGGQLQAAGYTATSGQDEGRKLVRNALIALIVKHPKTASDEIRQLAEQAGGFLVSAEVLGGEDAPTASLTIRVPEEKFDEVRAKIIKLGIQTETEKLEAEDVTKQYVDLSARLRNLRAQEGQYLGILKQAKTVTDTVAVSNKLNEVREQIDEQQAEFDTLSKQVETVAVAVTLRAEADVQVFGLKWRPLYRLKESARDGIDGLGDYASLMASFVFFIPALLLWVATILLGAAALWRLLCWVWRRFFVRPLVPS